MKLNSTEELEAAHRKALEIIEIFETILINSHSETRFLSKDLPYLDELKFVTKRKIEACNTAVKGICNSIRSLDSEEKGWPNLSIRNDECLARGV